MLCIYLPVEYLSEKNYLLHLFFLNGDAHFLLWNMHSSISQFTSHAVINCYIKQ